MMSETPKLVIAIELLEQALRLYLEELYFAALNLAGAAEEAFGAYVQDIGAQNSYERTKMSAVEISNILRKDGSKADPKENGGIN